ncbi:protein disulfide-isomerase domain protein, partial [Teladorsagia circumcincta]
IVEWVLTRTDVNYIPPSSAVVVLTAANFTDFVSEQALCLVEFYAPWCGHCKNLEPNYEKAAKKLRDQGSPIKLAKVNAEAEKELAQKSEYKGPRDAYGIINHMKELAMPAAKKLADAGSIDKYVFNLRL